MNKHLIDLLNKGFEEFPSSKAEKVAYDEIEQVFKNIGFNLPSSYKEFIHLYGGAMVGPYPVYGIRASKDMDEDEYSSIEVTQHYKKEGWFNTVWSRPGKYLVISMDHCGNPIALDEEGKVWIFDHDVRSTDLIANDFEEFLAKWCLGEEE
jgi:hypothetical protein